MTEPEPDIRRLWHDQPREEPAMSIDVIRSRALQFERKVRRWNRVAAVSFVLIIIAESWQIATHPELLERVGDLLTTAALVYVAFLSRGRVSVESMPAGLGLTTSVEFYQKQLARQRDLAANPWQYLALFVPGVALSLFGDVLDRPPAQTAAIAACGVALFLAVAWINKRTARRLQREIDELA